MTEWLRPVFARTRTPVLAASGPSIVDRPNSLSPEDSNGNDDLNTPKLRSSSRVPSYDPLPTLRDPETVYHMPSGDQLAEMLKVVMMNTGCMDAVPIQYNSTILHVLEAYWDLRLQVDAKQEMIEELKRVHTKDIKEIEELATHWQSKEIDYKKEIKRLEVLLSQTDGGMEAVSMARSRSVIHGTKGALDAIVRGIGTIKMRNATRNSRKTEVEESKSKLPIYASRTQKFTQTQETKPLGIAEVDGDGIARQDEIDKVPLYTASSRLLRSRTSKAVVQTRRIAPQASEQSEAKRRQKEQEFGASFGSSTSGPDSSAVSVIEQLATMRISQNSLGKAPEQKPLPDATNPTSQILGAPEGQLNFAELEGISIPQQMSFSFQPGDDTINLNIEVEEMPEKRSIEQICRKRSSNSEEPFGTLRPKSGRQHPSPRARLSLKTSAKVSGASFGAQGSDGVTNSTTAVRNTSARSSVNTCSSQKSPFKNARPILNKRTEEDFGSKEAVTAAAKAYSLGKHGALSQALASSPDRRKDAGKDRERSRRRIGGS